MPTAKPIMIRSFLPVGQGAFYLEQFGQGAEKINIIYDCGSATGVNFVNAQIDDAFEPDETIHAVFISHLHDDHMNGLLHLLKRCRVQRLFFPLLTQKSKILLILKYLSDGRSEEDFLLSFIWDPEEAIKQLGLDYSVILHPVLPNDEGEPERPSQDEFGKIPGEPVESGRPIDPGMIGISKIEWLYIPFNFRGTARRKALENELLKNFGRYCRPEDLLLNARNKDPDTIEKLAAAYRAVPGGFNANSLVLFSGCENLRIKQYIGGSKCCHISGSRYCHISCLCNSCLPGGCLYTGDYEAAGPLKWKELENAYKAYYDYIGCLQLPHHGSSRNFNVKFLNFPCCELYIVSAGYRNTHRHPHWSVIRDILAWGKRPIIVNEHPGSAFYLCVCCC